MNVLYEQWFRLADEDRDGMIGGMEAVKFFQRSGLPQNLLGEIWEYASNGAATLNLPQFCNAIRLVSLAQMNGGRIPQEQARGILAGTPVNIPPPKLQGLDSGSGYAAQMTGAPFATSYHPQVTGLVQPGYNPQMTGFQPGFGDPSGYASQVTGMRAGYPPQMTGPAPGPYASQMTGASTMMHTGASTMMQSTYPPVTPKDIQGYKNLFAQLDSDADNYVQGGEVAGHFLRSGLDKLVLRDIWAAVAGDAGKLGEDQFVKFAYLVEVSKKGVAVPKQLPAGPFPPINTASSAAMQLSSAPRPPAAMPMPAGPPSYPPAAPLSGPTGGAPPSWSLQNQFGSSGMQAAMDHAYNTNVSLPQLPPRLDGTSDPTQGPYQSRLPAFPEGMMGGLQHQERSKLEDHMREAEGLDKRLWEAEGGADAARSRAEQYKRALQDITVFKSRTDVALLQAQEQSNRLQQEAAALERQYQAAFSGAEGQHQRGNQMRDTIQRLLQQKSEAQAKLTSLQADLHRIATMGPGEMQQLEGEVGVLVEQVTGLESQRAAWEIQMEGARQQKALLSRKIDDLQMGSAAAEGELEGTKKEVRDLVKKVDAVRSSSDLRMVQSLLVKAAGAYKTLYHHAQSGGLEVPYEAQLDSIGRFMWSEDVLAGAADWMDADAASAAAAKGFTLVNAFPDLDALPAANLPPGAAPAARISSSSGGGLDAAPTSMFALPPAAPAPAMAFDDPILNSLGPLPPVTKKATPPASTAPSPRPAAASTSFEESAFGASAFGAPAPAAAAAPMAGFGPSPFGDAAFGAPAPFATASGGFDDNAGW